MSRLSDFPVTDGVIEGTSMTRDCADPRHGSGQWSEADNVELMVYMVIAPSLPSLSLPTVEKIIDFQLSPLSHF